MVGIYELVSGQLCLYVGQTVQTLKERGSKHRVKSNDTHSRYIPDYIDWEIKLIEECDEAVATAREQYWYDTKKPLYNYQRPGQTPKLYRQTEAGKMAARRYCQTEAGKMARREATRRFRLKKKAQEISPDTLDAIPAHTL